MQRLSERNIDTSTQGRYYIVFEKRYQLAAIVGKCSNLLLGYDPVDGLFCNAAALPYSPFLVVWCSEKDVKWCLWEREDFARAESATQPS